MDKNLSRDAKRMYCKLYRQYLEKKDNGIEEVEAIHFGSFEDIQEHLLPKKSRVDVAETIRELEEYKYIESVEINNLPYEVNLTEEGLSLMDCTFDCKVEQLSEYLKNLVN